MSDLLNQLTFTIEAGFGFTSAIFNLVPVLGNTANKATSVFIDFIRADGMTGRVTTIFGKGFAAQPVDDNGQNLFWITRWVAVFLCPNSAPA